jgi:hypothetical protein
MKSDDADFFLEIVKTQGVACSTVSDGHVLMFKRSFLKDLLEKYPNEEIAIFIQRPEFKN